MIEIVHLTKRFGSRTAVDDLTVEVGAGLVTGFVGPNGAGKSTTMRMLADLVRPDGGDVRVAGRRYRDLPDPARVVGMALDARGPHPGRTARHHLRGLAALSRLSPHRVEAVLDEVGLSGVGNQRVGGFSLGMRQRLAIASALLGEPEVLVLDEPANGLDPAGIRWLRTLLRRFADEGGTVFVSTHLLAELTGYADELVVLGGGRLLAHGPVASFGGDGTELEDRLVELTASAAEFTAR